MVKKVRDNMFLREINQDNNLRSYILFTLAYNGMPTLKNIKPSSFIHFQRKYMNEINNFHIILKNELDKFECSYEVIYSDIKSLYILFYQERQLKVLLNNYSNNSILLGNGYGVGENSIQTVLEVFKARYKKYMLLKTEFPHELGLFLGYPLLDVEGFINNDGKNYLMNGYWKVYQNVEYALNTFKIYTYLRKEAEKFYTQGCDLTGCFTQTLSKQIRPVDIDLI